MRQNYREVDMKRVRISWRCEMCQVEEHKTFDQPLLLDWSDEPQFEHDWVFIDQKVFGDRQGPAVCSRTCAEAWAAQRVDQAYPQPVTEEMAG